jgi:phytoene synthase
MSPSHPIRPAVDDTTHNPIDTSTHLTSAPQARGLFDAIGSGSPELGAAHSQASFSDHMGPLTASFNGFSAAPPMSTRSQGPLVDVDTALDVCEHIASAKACDLYQGIEGLSAYRRRALCAIYAFACRVQDAADGDLPPQEKLWLLNEARAGIPREGAPRPVDPVLVALRDSHRRFRLPLSALDDLIDGVECDVHGCTFDTFHELLWYCRQVGGSIARLTISVLGSCDPVAAGRPADDLGVAIQLTTILHHLAEDLQRGRMYLPREDLARFDCPADLAAAPPEALGQLVGYQARRNREWYDRSLSLLPLLDIRGASCIAQVTAIHTRILDRIEHSLAHVSQEPAAASRAARVTVIELASDNGQTPRPDPYFACSK